MRRLARLSPLWLALLSVGCDAIEARSLVNEGNALYRAGKMEQALAKFKAAAARDPKLSLASLHAGYAQMNLAANGGPRAAEHYRGAAASFERYMELAPGDPRGSKFYVQVLIDSGQLDRALRFLRGEHQRHPNNAALVASLGRLSSKAGHFTEALGWYEKRAELSPDDPTAHYLIGTLCWEHLHGEDGERIDKAARIELADRGIRALERAIELRPRYTEALTYINLLYRERAEGQSDPAARRRDVKTADRYHRRALELLESKRRAGH